jgi:hypothetical protein
MLGRLQKRIRIWRLERIIKRYDRSLSFAHISIIDGKECQCCDPQPELSEKAFNAMNELHAIYEENEKDVVPN